MSIINRHERCVGIRLWKSKTRFIQLWYCPRGYKVKPHSHNDQRIELMYLFGKTIFHREAKDVFMKGKPLETTYVRVESYSPKWYHMFRKFTVSAGQVHWFTVSSFPLVFINFATFIDGKRPVSAATDFHTT